MQENKSFMTNNYYPEHIPLAQSTHGLNAQSYDIHIIMLKGTCRSYKSVPKWMHCLLLNSILKTDCQKKVTNKEQILKNLFLNLKLKKPCITKHLKTIHPYHTPEALTYYQ